MIENQQTLTVSITVDDARAALDFYEKALNAKIVSKFEMPDGTVAHADVMIGNTAVYVSGEFPDWNAFSPKTIGGSPNLLCITEEDCDALFQQAIDAGGEILSPMQDHVWGTRSGLFVDPFGYRWTIGKVIEKLTPEQLMERMSQMPPPDSE